MRLDPVAEKTGRHREPHRSLLHGFELHAPEPAAEDILAKFRAQLILDPSPSLLIGACHLDAFRFERNRSEHATQTLSTSRKRSTSRCREVAAQPPKPADLSRRGRTQPVDGIPGW